MAELKFFFHEHQLILNEAEPVVGKDVECVGCKQPINKLIDAFYRCNKSLIDSSPASDCVGFYMHKTCSELPSTFTHPMNPKKPLSLFVLPYKKEYFYICHACDSHSQHFMYGSDSSVSSEFRVCLKCVMSELKSLEDRNLCHPGHNHPLTLVQSPALFLCHACNTTATDLSYICTRCCFYIHKNCANAPTTYQSKFHNEHALILTYSLPQQYRQYLCYCSICEKHINPIYWVYICANCRFFAHVKCASLTEMLSESDIDDEADCGESSLMQFPVHDEASLHETMQQCIIKAVNPSTGEPSPYINHWAHGHQLALGNKNAKTLPLNLKPKIAETELLICDGCMNPISLVDVFYECSLCNFFLHRSCSQFPKRIKHHLAGDLEAVLARESGELYTFQCSGCGIYGNGICMLNDEYTFDIKCASLPRIIKHKGHRHPLQQLKTPDDFLCKGCWREPVTEEVRTIVYGCEKCEFYTHIGCVLSAQVVKHRWDPHPLYLILSLKNVPDHPHEFPCEFCSKEINTNSWFYHCNVCDLSFHISCIDPDDWLSNIKFGATNIYSDKHPHPHGLTYILNKKTRNCNLCGEDARDTPALQCSPCKYIVHRNCFIKE
nr:PREDICTED: uncharacterized protein LOC108211498 isoform X1 [Daucus carota subsp. sativus]